MHRHDCDLWEPPAPSSYRIVYREHRNFPPEITEGTEQRVHALKECEDGGFRSVNAKMLLPATGRHVVVRRK